MDLTDEQWERIKGLFPTAEARAPGRRGGRPWRATREVVNGVLWVMRTGAPWADLPPRYPPPSTCHRRFQAWVKAGVMVRVLAALRRDLDERGGVEDVEGFTLRQAQGGRKRGATASGNAERAKRPRSWRLPTAMVFRSLSLLETETGTTPFSPTELSMLLSYTRCRHDSSATRRGTRGRCKNGLPESVASN